MLVNYLQIANQRILASSWFSS